MPMHLSWFFRLKPMVRWVFRCVKMLHSIRIHSLSIPTIKYYRIHAYASMQAYVCIYLHVYVYLLIYYLLVAAVL